MYGWIARTTQQHPLQQKQRLLQQPALGWRQHHGAALAGPITCRRVGLMPSVEALGARKCTPKRPSTSAHSTRDRRPQVPLRGIAGSVESGWQLVPFACGPSSAVWIRHPYQCMQPSQSTLPPTITPGAWPLSRNGDLPRTERRWRRCGRWPSLGCITRRQHCLRVCEQHNQGWPTCRRGSSNPCNPAHYGASRRVT